MSRQNRARRTTKTASKSQLQTASIRQTPILPPDDAGFIDLKMITSCNRTGRVGLLPITDRTWARGVQAEKFPKPVRLGGRLLWNVGTIRSLLEHIGQGGFADA